MKATKTSKPFCRLDFTVKNAPHTSGLELVYWKDLASLIDDLRFASLWQNKEKLWEVIIREF